MSFTLSPSGCEPSSPCGKVVDMEDKVTVQDLKVGHMYVSDVHVYVWRWRRTVKNHSNFVEQTFIRTPFIVRSTAVSAYTIVTLLDDGLDWMLPHWALSHHPFIPFT